jgi:predicted RNA polymerase sigma factor
LPSTTVTLHAHPGITSIPAAEDTDWPQILVLYELLERISPNQMVTLNHAVAVAMVQGPQAVLELLRTLDEDDRISNHHRLDAVRAHLLELAGDRAAAARATGARHAVLPAFPSSATSRPAQLAG